MARPSFVDLYFGMSDSRTEAAQNPDEFVRSFVNLRDSLGSVTSGSRFVVLGPKGTGKSAIAWYLNTTQTVGQYRVMIRDASTLPLAEVPHMKTGQPEGPERAVTAWKFILLCNYLELQLADPSSPLHLDAEVGSIAAALREYGFIGDGAGKALLGASKTTWKIPVPKVGTIYERERVREVNIFSAIPHLERWVSYTGASVPLMLLDGLDSIFLNDRRYSESLGSLVQAAYGLNHSIREKGGNGSIALLLRNDVFSKVSEILPDSQKMRDDHAVQLDWRVLSGARGITSPLVQLVNAKAARALDVDYVDVLSYFRGDIQQGAAGRAPTWTPTLRYLLNLTRHTPRDMLRLLDNIRQVQAEQPHLAREKKLRDDVIREGVLRYSSEYFVGAIKNEFAGFDTGAIGVNDALAALQHVGKTTFTRAQFLDALQSDTPSASTQDANLLLRRMFMAGAIGNLVSQPSGGSYLQFYHRKDDAEVHLAGQFMLANPLAHAWNIPFAHSS